MKATPILLLILFFGGFTAMTSCAQANPPSRRIIKPPFKNADFEILLGPNWTRRENTESFEWEDSESMEEVVISVLNSKEPMDSLKISTMASEIMKIRKQSVVEISEGKAKFEDVKISKKDASTEAEVFGLDPVYEMQIYITVVARPTRIVSLSYYKYRPLMTDRAFKNKSKELRAAMTVK